MSTGPSDTEASTRAWTAVTTGRSAEGWRREISGPRVAWETPEGQPELLVDQAVNCVARGWLSGLVCRRGCASLLDVLCSRGSSESRAALTPETGTLGLGQAPRRRMKRFTLPVGGYARAAETIPSARGSTCSRQGGTTCSCGKSGRERSGHEPSGSHPRREHKGHGP